MPRLAPAIAAVLALVAAGSARAEPLDLDLVRLGAPDPNVWTTILADSTRSAALARESRQRFAVLSSEMALAMSGAVLHPASTTGHSGFTFDLEVASVAVHPGAIGDAPPAGFSSSPWTTRSSPSEQLYLPSVHVRKALPFSFELGGRMIYLNRSSYYAAQGEAKWALNEGFAYVPDLAVRVAYTRLFGQKDWNLGTTDLDLIVSKRWGMSGVTSLTPYVAARLAFVSASSHRMDFAPDLSAGSTDPVEIMQTQAEFPRFRATFYRTTVGLRFTADVISLAAEGTYFGGASPSDGDYEGTKVKSSFGGAAKAGFEF
jgi:hypothetical protein